MNKKSVIWYDIIFYIILFIFAFLFVRFFGFATVSGRSMYPTLKDNDYLLISKKSKPNKNDIVVIKRSGDTKYLVKRVIATSGDTLKFDSNNIYINDSKLKERYLNSEEEILYTDSSVTIGDNCFYVLGDNRNHSGDSRIFGEVSREEIKGVVKLNLSSIGLSQFNIRIITAIVIFIILVYNARLRKLNVQED